MEDGSEVAVPSVDALARRLERGEVLPDTQLFDLGTGEWAPARESHIVRFILEEREREGGEALEGWEEEVALDPEAIPGPEESGEAEDPFDMDLTLEPGAASAPETEAPEEEAGEEEAVEEEAEAEGEDEEASEPSGLRPRRDPYGDLPLMDWDEEEAEEQAADEESGEAAPEDEEAVVEEGVGDDLVAGSGVEVEEWAGPAEAPPESEDVETPPEAPAAETPPAAEPDRAEDREERREPSRARPAKKRAPARRPPRRRVPAGAFLVVVLLAAVGGALFLGVRFVDVPFLGEGEREAPEVAEDDPADPGLLRGSLPEVATVPPVPEGLEGPVERALEAVERRFQATVDSLRAVHGVEDRPPRDWLGGYYLAHASEFPGVLAFWEGYLEVLDELRGMDEELFHAAAAEAVAGEPASESDAAVGYLEDRYRSTLPARRGRYDLLAAVARQAVELHEFLEENEGAIRYTPALGPEVPLDPILEAQSDDPEVHRGMLDRLDGMFRVLDRSRGGGAPSPGGLGVDLFQRFGEG